MAHQPRQWTLPQLADEAKVPARTVRFYISRGLLPAPIGGGRSAMYGDEHLERLRRIRAMQQQGKMLAEIALALNGASMPDLPQPSAWWQYPVSPDVLVWVRADGSPWRLKQVRDALEQLSARLEADPEKEEEDGSK